MLIPPKYSEVRTRDDVDLTTQFGPIKLHLPIISANMKTVTGPTMVKAMHDAGGVGILHRFWSNEENVEAFKNVNKLIAADHIGVSVGVKFEEKDRFCMLDEAGASMVCVDIAHGHHIYMKEMIEFIRKVQTKPITIIAGNIATPDAACDLMSWGADIIKVGIGPGSHCITRRNTGIGVDQIEAIQNIHEIYPNIPLIADGGCRTGKDIVDMLAAGAQTVMIGGILAGTIETPGKVYPNDDGDLINRTFYKTYGGSASAQNKGEHRFVEGKVSMIPFKGHVKYILREIKHYLQSACSYVGCSNITDFRNTAKDE